MKYSNLHNIRVKDNSSTESFESRTEVFIQKVNNIIHANINNEDFTVSTLATQMHLSVSQLNRKLKRLINQPAGQLIRAYRMKHATKLLINDVASIGEIAYQVGYMNHAHFCRSFKREFGCSPSQYLKENKSNNSLPLNNSSLITLK